MSQYFAKLSVPPYLMELQQNSNRLSSKLLLPGTEWPTHMQPRREEMEPIIAG